MTTPLHGDFGPPASRRPSGTSRSLAPREHGAYGQLAVPMATALLMGKPGPGAWLLAVGAVAAFAAQEPLRVALGHRGTKAQREDGPRARRLGGWLGGVALASGGAALALIPAGTRWLVALPAVLGAVGVGLVGARREKTLPGELLAAVALASVGVPIAVAGGVTPLASLAAWGSWSVGLCAATFAVRSTILHAREPQSAWRRLRAPGLLALVTAAAGGAGAVPVWSALAASPLLLASAALAARPPAPHHLKRVGWGLVAATLLTAALLGASRLHIASAGAATERSADRAGTAALPGAAGLCHAGAP